MTKEEVDILVELIIEIDGGCPSCIGSFCDDLQEKFPEYQWRKLCREKYDLVDLI